MFIAKFVVPVARNFQTNIRKLALRNGESDKRVIRDEVKKSKEENVMRVKTMKHEEPGCNINNAVDNYQEVYKNITNHAKTIKENIRNETKSLLDHLKREIEASKSGEQNQIQTSLYEIKKKLQRLLVLDPSFGSIKRKSAMSLNHEISQAFRDIDCDIVPQIKRINAISTKLENDIEDHVDRAGSLLLACRKCKNPVTLNKCIEENANYAKKILDRTSENAKACMNKIGTLQHEILQHHKSAIGEISRTYSKKSKEFSKHLDDCILAAKNEKKQ